MNMANIATFNVKGINEISKRMAVEDWAHENPIDIHASLKYCKIHVVLNLWAMVCWSGMEGLGANGSGFSAQG